MSEGRSGNKKPGYSESERSGLRSMNEKDRKAGSFYLMGPVGLGPGPTRSKGHRVTGAYFLLQHRKQNDANIFQW